MDYSLMYNQPHRKKYIYICHLKNELLPRPLDCAISNQQWAEFPKR